MTTADKVKIWHSPQKGIFAVINKLKTKSENIKTGDMAGLYVLPITEAPTASIKNKRDIQCGTCPLKGNVCYVNPITTNGVWKSGVELEVNIPTKTSKPLRLGVYGDTGLLPYTLIQKIVSRFSGHSGYTHQWQHINPKHAKFHMASIDDISAKQANMTSAELKQKANDLGYRTYRIIQNEAQILKDEILCPHYTRGLQCADCLLCDGANNKKNIVAHIHGPQNKIKTYKTNTN